MSALHIDVCFTDWEDEVNVKVVDHVGDQPHEDDETGIFKVR